MLSHSEDVVRDGSARLAGLSLRGVCSKDDRAHVEQPKGVEDPWSLVVILPMLE